MRSKSLINVETVEVLERFNLKRNFVIFGLILVGLAILAGLVPHIQIPVSSVLTDESFVVPSFSYHALNWSFLEETTLNITFEVAENRSITFWVLNEANYYRKIANESYGWFVDISHPYTSSMDTEWNPPVNVSIYFMWDNHYSHTSKEVHPLFTMKYARALLPSTVSYFGILCLSIGLTILYYGSRARVRNIEEIDSLKASKL